MCYWKKLCKDREQKMAPIVVWPLILRKRKGVAVRRCSRCAGGYYVDACN